MSKNQVELFSKEFVNYNEKLSRTLLLLEGMGKPIIKEIIKKIKEGKVNLLYSSYTKDLRVLVEDPKTKKVYVNISEISNNLDNNITKQTVPVGDLYSYIYQGYSLTKWESLKNNRAFIAAFLDIYYTLWSNVISNMGVGHFKTELDRSKLKFLLSTYILTTNNTIISDIMGYAERFSNINSDTAKTLKEKYRDYFVKDMDLDDFYFGILTQEFSFLNKVENINQVVYTAIRMYGPTAATMLSEMKYLLPLAADYTQLGRPLVYSRYGGLSTLIKSSDIRVINDLIIR